MSQTINIRPDPFFHIFTSRSSPSIPSSDTIVTDYDGNQYLIIEIGTQNWMGSNLKTIHYNDGTPILSVLEADWYGNDSVGAYCWYDNDSATYSDPYGALYNWYAVETGKLCPVGWEVPDTNDFTVLINYLGSDTAGSMMKEIGTDHWNDNSDATNSSGFTAVGSGVIQSIFENIKDYNWIWTTISYDESSSYALCISSDAIDVTISSGPEKLNGYTVRCIKTE